MRNGQKKGIPHPFASAGCAASRLTLPFLRVLAGVTALGICCSHVLAATVQTRYYGHEAVHDRYGVITPIDPGDWMNGDLGQRATSVLNGFVDYYRYTGDLAAVAHVTYMADYILDHCVTPSDPP